MTPDQIKIALSRFPVRVNPNTGNIMTCPVRLSYPHLFKPHVPKKYPNADPKYSTTVLFPLGADLSVIRAAVKECGFAAFGQNWNAAKGSPLMDQGQEQGPGYVPGAFFCRSTSSEAPAVKLRDARTNATPADIYPGVWAIVSLRPFANTYKNSVQLGLQNVMKFADGEKLAGGSRSAEADFDPIDADDLPFDVDADASAFG